MHFQKNCRRYDPQGFQPDKPDWWVPQYESGGLRFRVEDITANECPVSLITPETMWLVQLLSKQMRVQRAASAPLFGPDASAWPAWWYDAVETGQHVLDLEESAAAEERRRRQQLGV